jgi:ABC-type sugar transport system permease subunit
MAREVGADQSGEVGAERPYDVGEDRTILSRLKENWVGYLFILPIFVMFTLLFYFPILRGVWLTLTRSTLGASNDFVGLNNYAWLVTNDLFVYSLGWTLIFVFCTLFLQLTLGLMAALLLNELASGWREWASAVVMSPYFSAPLAGGVIWMWFLSPNFGGIARTFTVFGWQPIGFLSEGVWPFVSLIVAQAWHDYAYAGIIYAAALKSIPKDQYEAAAMSGANRLKRFRDVTVPHLLTPTIIILAIRTTWNLAEFAQPFEMTGGGPGTKTMLLSILTYRTAYVNNSFGRAYTIGMVMIGISIIAALVYLKSIKDEQQLYV